MNATARRLVTGAVTGILIAAAGTGPAYAERTAAAGTWTVDLTGAPKDGSKVKPGKVMTYVIRVVNVGSDPVEGALVNVEIADLVDDAAIGELPAGVTLAGTTLTWAVPSVPPGGFIRAYFTATAKLRPRGAVAVAVAAPATVGGTCTPVCSVSHPLTRGTIVPSPVPTITGRARVGSALKVVTGKWAVGTTLSFTWFVRGEEDPWRHVASLPDPSRRPRRPDPGECHGHQADLPADHPHQREDATGRGPTGLSREAATPRGLGDTVVLAVPLTTAMSALPATPESTQPRTYEVRTYGCQMNVHDSERLSGLLEEAGYVAATEGDQADVVVFNTCAVRENADNRLYGNLGHLAPVKAKRPGMQIAVGGCLAQKDRATITEKAPWVDVVFGTHNIGSLPVLLERARVADEAQVEILESLEVFPSTLPTRRESAYAAWVSVSVGCNNTCTFCIVPSLRGKEEDRRPGEILAEIEALVAEGVCEITLLGQNVNSYGVGFGDREAFSKLLRACGDVDGLERVRFTSPHPAEFTDDVIQAMAETPNVMPQLHMPLQSGSDRVLRAMRRSYRQARFLGILDRVRVSIPEAAITTDIIVGFPGETEEDFQGTLDVVRRARFSGAFTFQYSKRPGTPAADLPDQISREVVQDRYERLADLVTDIAWEENKRLVGRRVELLVSEGEGRKDAATHRLSGRGPDNRLVHFRVDGLDTVSLRSPGSTKEGGSTNDSLVEPARGTSAESRPRPGDLVTVEITKAAPHHLVADGPLLGVRRTRSGDAWEARTSAPRQAGVSLGMPAVGVPAPVSPAPVCG